MSARILTGEIRFAELDQEDWFRSGYLLSKLDDPELLAEVAAGLQGCEIEIELGTWCGDTREYLPELIRILDEAKFPRERARLVAFPRDKKLGDRVAERLPTFIVTRAGRELGRIVESPRLSLLEDLSAIVAPSRR